MALRMGTKRLRDPIHDLIVFRAEDDLDQLAWRLIDTREFQRLRRIRQLGFSEFVYPGATHTRFSHCIGVFHAARRLLEVIRRKVGASNYEEERATVALCAALLHDLGHGPFSHTFEKIVGNLGSRKKDKDWSAEIVTGDTQVHEELDRFSSGLAAQVAELMKQREPKDIYAAVVNSQFDADRLDYLMRDRYMTGTASGGIDFEWLVDCLEVGRITIRVGEEEDYEEVDGLYLNHKGLRAAEEYLLARFHLYSQVYMHKTTRAAEQMLGAVMAAVADRVASGESELTGLREGSPLLAFYKSDIGLESFLTLDDTVVWASLREMVDSNDELIADLSARLLDRRLYKCFDAGIRALAIGSDSLQRFRKVLNDRGSTMGLVDGKTLLKDEAPISAYGIHSFEERGALQKVLIGVEGDGQPKDVAERSKVIEAISDNKPVRLFRVYAPDRNCVEKLDELWMETIS